MYVPTIVYVLLQCIIILFLFYVSNNGFWCSSITFHPQEAVDPSHPHSINVHGLTSGVLINKIFILKI